ncbi:MAG: class I SAM-dependent methyltransferase [Acidobacteriota bacterium]
MTDRIKSQWQTEEVVATYLSGVRGAIPAADLQLAVIEKIVRLWSKTPALILDLGCGDGILGRYLLDAFPAARGVFADFSDPMLEAVRKKLSGSSRAVVVKTDYGEPDWVESVRQQEPFDIVVSGFSIHHQPDARKRTLYAEIFDLLRDGGIFLNLEHVASRSPAGQWLFNEFFVDHLFAYHRRSDPETTREAISVAYYNRPDKKENILALVEDQCRWLEEIGFSDVDCFFRVFELALFGGRKNPLHSAG